MDCKGCGGSLSAVRCDCYIGPECWDGYCRSCSLDRPAYAEYLEQLTMENSTMDANQLTTEIDRLTRFTDQIANDIRAVVNALAEQDADVTRIKNELSAKPSFPGNATTKLCYYCKTTIYDQQAECMVYGRTYHYECRLIERADVAERNHSDLIVVHAATVAQLAHTEAERDELRERCKHIEQVRSQTYSQYQNLHDAVIKAGWSIMETSGECSIHDCSAEAIANEDREPNLIEKTIDLEHRLAEMTRERDELRRKLSDVEPHKLTDCICVIRDKVVASQIEVQFSAGGELSPDDWTPDELADVLDSVNPIIAEVLPIESQDEIDSLESKLPDAHDLRRGGFISEAEDAVDPSTSAPQPLTREELVELCKVSTNAIENHIRRGTYWHSFTDIFARHADLIARLDVPAVPDRWDRVHEVLRSLRELDVDNQQWWVAFTEDGDLSMTDVIDNEHPLNTDCDTLEDWEAWIAAERAQREVATKPAIIADEVESLRRHAVGLERACKMMLATWGSQDEAAILEARDAARKVVGL